MRMSGELQFVCRFLRVAIVHRRTVPCDLKGELTRYSFFATKALKRTVGDDSRGEQMGEFRYDSSSLNGLTRRFLDFPCTTLQLPYPSCRGPCHQLVLS
jgi:hypothetical protein